MFNLVSTFIAIVKNSRLPSQKISLGRWNTVYKSNHINTRVDLSNEDHCGPCGQYVLQQKEKNKFVNKK
jgi:hypothetical protein